MSSNLGRGPIQVGAPGSEVTVIGAAGETYHGGVEITASAAEINRVADKSGSIVAANDSTLTVTEALHGDRLIAFGKLAGTIVTLPAATGTGNKYTFVISIAATSNANIIKVANATDVMDGSLNIQQDTDADGTLKCWMAEVGDDTITMAGAATTGGIVGNRIECIDYAAGFWSCTAWTISGGGSEATPFSATVA
ncbi:hypothetical protein KAR91_84085 [Candidatus Pacearchaeota archaeon]|nr:hypothetical protein [Candidatus Pacearchaeota archaeon]